MNPLCLLIGGILPITATPLEEWRRAYDDGRFFDLVAALPEIRRSESLEAEFYEGFTLAGLNRLEEAVPLLKRAVLIRDPKIRTAAWENLSVAHARGGRYGAAANALAKLLSISEPSKKPDVENSRRLWGSLRDVPPTRVTKKRESVLRPSVAEGFKMPFECGGRKFELGADTGANISLVREGIGKQLGLRMIPASLDIGSITGAKVKAWLGVANELKFGNATVSNVVFLVMRDKDLTFPAANFRLDGVIGLPVLMALGQTSFARDATVSIPRTVSRKGSSNLFLSGFQPYVLGEFQGKRLAFAFDSGANDTMLYASFHRAFRKDLDARGFPRVHRVMGVAGVKETPALMLTDLEIEFGGRMARWDQIDVLTVVRHKDGERFFGNVGQDMLKQFDRATFDWVSMRLNLEGEWRPAAE